MAPLVLMFSDALSFLVAGGLGLGLSMAMGNAMPPRPDALLDFTVREQLNDFLLAGTVWILWFLVFKNRYRRAIPFWSEVAESSRTLILMALVNLAMIALARNDYSRSIFFLGWSLLIPMIPLFRMIARRILLRLGALSRPTWIIGKGENAEEAQRALEGEWQMGFAIQGWLDPQDVTQLFLARLLGAVSMRTKGVPSDLTFIIAVDEGVDVSELIQELSLFGIQSIQVIPALRGIPLYGAELSHFFSHEVLMLGIRNNLSMRFSKVVKRIFDIVVASLLLLPAGLILAMAGALIWIEDGCPLFYIQKRMGQQKREFGMIKLRSMRRDAEAQLADWRQMDSPEWKTYCANNFKLAHDPRLLKVGGFLRRMSIDELPQLINVLKGDMSLVGPRPILSREIDDYGKTISLYASTKPGMTGLWQVSGRSKTSFVQRATLDGWYIRNWSLGYDIVILFRTIGVVFRGGGAY